MNAQAGQLLKSVEPSCVQERLQGMNRLYEPRNEKSINQSDGIWNDEDPTYDDEQRDWNLFDQKIEAKARSFSHPSVVEMFTE